MQYSPFDQGSVGFCPMLQRVPPSYVRFLHASPGAPNVDIYSNGTLVASNLPYRGFTEYLTAPPGNYSIRVFPAGQKVNPVLDTNAVIQPGTIYTAAITGRVPDLSILPVPEPITPIPSGRLNLRFVHLSPDAPAVDVTLPNGTKLFTNISFKQIANYIPVRPGTYTFQLRIAGTNRVILTVPNMNLKPNRFYTLYAVGLAAGNPPLQLLVPLDGNSYLMK